MHWITLRRVLPVLGLAFAPAAPAQTFTWDGGLSHSNFTVNNNWSTPNNWVGAVVPVSDVNSAIVFTQSGVWTTATQNVANPFVLNSMIFDATSNVTSFSGSPLTFAANGIGARPVLHHLSATHVIIGNDLTLSSDVFIVAADGTGGLTLAGNISGPTALFTEGNGFLQLSGNNTFTGGTEFAGGILQVASPGALGFTGSISFTQGTLQYSGSNATDYSPRFSPVSGEAFSIDTNGLNVTFASPLISSGGTLTKLGSGALTLSAASTFDGPTNINGGSIKLGVGNALANTTGNVNVNGGLDLNGLAAATLGGLAGSGSIAVGSTATVLTVGGNNAATSYSGSLTGTATDVVKAGTGALTLSGAGSNFHSLGVGSGSVIIDGGGLTLTSSSDSNTAHRVIEVGNSSATALLMVQGGAVFDTSGAKEAIVGLSAAPQAVTIQGNGTLWKLPFQTDIGGGGVGTLTVQGGSHVSGGTFLDLGNSGSGTLQILGGGQVTTNSVFIAFGGAGSITVNDPGSSLSANSMFLAYYGGADVGSLTVAAGGSVVVNGTTQLNSATSSITIRGGTMTTDSLVQGTGLTPTIALSDPAVGYALTVGTGNSSSTFAGSISDAVAGPGTVAKVGSGVLTLTGHLTNTGGYTATAGTIEFSGTVVQPGSGSLTAAAGATIQYDAGARVFGGFLYGPGTHIVTGGSAFTGTTAFNNAMINATGPGSFVSFINGGTLKVTAGPNSRAVFNGFTNQGSGSITVGAASAVSVANFQTYGTLTVTPNTTAAPTILTNTGTTPLSFNGGSRTFIGTPATAPQYAAGIDLQGQNAVVAGGLFVNNGFVADGGPAGAATVIADFGALVKGAGFFQNSVITQNGGKFQAGNSPGSAAFGNFVFGPGGASNYVFAIDDATGVAGPSPDAAGHVSGWGLIKVVRRQIGTTNTSGDFTWTATPADKLTFALDTLINPTTVGVDVGGPMADFDPSRAYSWPAVQWSGTYAGPTDAVALTAATTFDTSGFLNPVAGAFGWSLDAAADTLSLTYSPTPVPEPGTLALSGIAAIGWVTFWRRRWQTTGPSATPSA